MSNIAVRAQGDKPLGRRVIPPPHLEPHDPQSEDAIAVQVFLRATESLIEVVGCRRARLMLQQTWDALT